MPFHATPAARAQRALQNAARGKARICACYARSVAARGAVAGAYKAYNALRRQTRAQRKAKKDKTLLRRRRFTPPCRFSFRRYFSFSPPPPR